MEGYFWSLRLDRRIPEREPSMKDIRELSYGRMRLWSLPDEEPQSLEAPEDHCRNDEHSEDASRTGKLLPINGSKARW